MCICGPVFFFFFFEIRTCMIGHTKVLSLLISETDLLREVGIM